MSFCGHHSSRSAAVNGDPHMPVNRVDSSDAFPFIFMPDVDMSEAQWADLGRILLSFNFADQEDLSFYGM
jgi:hypothetical protein